MSFICMRMKSHVHINSWAFNLVLIQGPGLTRKWPPIAWRFHSQFVLKKFISGLCSTAYKLQRQTIFLSTDLTIFFPSLSAFRLVNAKSMVLVDQWKKVSHSNLVSLREVFTTKAFGDNCMYSMHFCYVVVDSLVEIATERHLTISALQQHVFVFFNPGEFHLT